MANFNQLICQVSSERVYENMVRATAFGVVITMGGFFISGNPCQSSSLRSANAYAPSEMALLAPIRLVPIPTLGFSS
jgi:hypothetical protein